MLIKPLSLRSRGVIPRCWHCASNSAKWLLAEAFRILRSVPQGLSTQIPRACVSSSRLTSSPTTSRRSPGCPLLFSARASQERQLEVNPVFRGCRSFFRCARILPGTADYPRCFVSFSMARSSATRQRVERGARLTPTMGATRRGKGTH